MPLEIKDIEWNETEHVLTLRVPLKGASTKNLDIFSSPNYIKVSVPPYYYEVALFEGIDDENSKAVISNGQVQFHLQKLQPKTWGQLHTNQHKDKAFMKNLREESVTTKQQKEQTKEKERQRTRDQQKKYAVREQMRVDSEEREMREAKKLDEMTEISNEMESWKIKELQQDDDDDDGGENESETRCVVNQTRINQGSKVAENNQKNNNVSRPPKREQDTTNNKLEEQKDKNEVVPAPRQSGNINVEFTPRKLATPARESKLPEEELWLKKVSDMNKMRKVENEDDVVDIEEMNPVWLKDKGNDFFKKGNFVAAINAYTSALMLDSKIPMIYANRAACHLSLKQYNECIQDCSNALELYDPPVSDNAMSRCRAFTRRGTAHFHMQDFVNALRDYEAAIKLDPKNQELKTDAFKIRRTLQGGESSD